MIAHSFELFRSLLLWAACWLFPSLCLATAIYLLLSMPQRRRERARFFLDLLWVGLQTGRTPEETIVSAAQVRDRAPGVRFHLLAAHLESGLRLGSALDKVPRLLPPPLRGMIQAGERSGRLTEVVGMCRRSVVENAWQFRQALSHAAVLLVVLLPIQLLLINFQRIWILPKLQDIVSDFETPLPAFTQFVLYRFDQGLFVLLMLGFALGLGALVIIGGPRVSQWFGPISDWILWRLPWTRYRLQAQLASMLGLLLDAGLSEREAVELAARSTGSRIWIRRGEAVAVRLASGLALPEALAPLDQRGELKWRVANAAAGGSSGFYPALRGWQQALVLKAYGVEQAAAQLSTAGLIIVNGVFVGLVGSSMFMLFISLIQNELLW